MQEGKATRH